MLGRWKARNGWWFTSRKRYAPARWLPKIRQAAAAQDSRPKKVSRDFSAKCNYPPELGLPPEPHART
jgi:hypothetical protein